MKNKLYIFLGIAFFALIINLNSWGLTESSEARYATIAKEMFLNNDYINPTLLGIKHLHKPPATYYITALGYEIFGINEFGARFFMQIALLFQIFLVFKITLLLYKNEKIALLASLVYFSFPITIIAVRTLTTDAYLTTFILASIYFWLQYKETFKPYLLYLFYFFLGLIFETKGPVGFIVPLTFIIAYKLIYKEKIATNIHQFLGLLLFLLVSASWYLAVINKNEHLLEYFINNQLIERVSQNKFKRGKPFWYYLLIMPLIGLPWLFYLIFYIKKNIKIIFTQKNIEYILLITFSILFVTLSISTSKLILYVLPLYSLLAILIAKYLSESTSDVIRNISTFYILLILLISISVITISFLTTKVVINSKFAFIITFCFGTIYFTIYKYVKSTYLKPGYFGVVFIIFITFLFNHILKQNELKINSVKPIAEFIKENSNQEDYEVIVYNYLLPSLSYYLNKDILTINHGKYTTQRETQFEINNNWKKTLINYFDVEDRARLLTIKNKKPIFLIKSKKSNLPDTLLILQQKLKNKKIFGKFEVYY
ncbi:ArnT family glycosyltransferase [Lutibacter sp.]